MIRNVIKKLSLISILACSIPIAHGQFWQGFLRGMNDAIQRQSYQYQRQQYQKQQDRQTKTENEEYNEYTTKIEKNKRVEDDGFIWYIYSVIKGPDIAFGALDEEGNILIPPKYNLIVYIKCGSFFYVSDWDNGNGAYTKNGHKIIDAVCDEIFSMNEDGTLFEYKKNGKTGALDAEGNVIVTPSSLYNDGFLYSSIDGFKYKNSNGDYVPIGIDIHGNRIQNEQSEIYSQEVNHKEWIERNDIESIESYCRQELFFTYGGYGAGDLYVRPIDNITAEDVIDLLQYGASQKDPNCQFMLACVLSGNKTIRGYDDDQNEIVLPTPKDYKYLNDEEAQRYFKLYFNNPKMDKESGAFGYTSVQTMKLIKNAYPNLYLELLHR